MCAPPSILSGADFTWRFSHYAGLYFDEFDPGSAWIRESAELRLPPSEHAQTLFLRGEIRPHPAAHGLESAAPGLVCRVDGVRAGGLRNLAPGPFEIRLTVPPKPAGHESRITLCLTGVRLTNFLAWIGRLTGVGSLQRFRRQRKNRQLRLISHQRRGRGGLRFFHPPRTLFHRLC